MTDRVKGFTVVLKEDTRIDDIEHIKIALEMISGIIKVEPVIATGDEYLTEMKKEQEFREKVLELYQSI